MERFWSKVDRRDSDECWLWTACITKPSKYGSGGYGLFYMGKDAKPRLATAHRVAYEWLVGPIPAGLQLDHLCRVRHCVNPAHLEPVTARVNLLRGETRAAANAVKTHCPQGHEYDGFNINGARICHRCQAAAAAVARSRRRNAA